MNRSLRIARVGLHDLGLPAYQTAGAAGLDLQACLPAPITLAPLARHAVPTGFAVEIPSGFELQIRARSGLALRHGLTLVNGVGTIDSDYRGELAVLLVNLGAGPVTIAHGDRIAQAVLAPVTRILWEECADLSETVRGPNGFGSTGLHDTQSGATALDAARFDPGDPASDDVSPTGQ
ncbi:MAG: dUTP diphosphatase [Pseudomonadota bacterium]